MIFLAYTDVCLTFALSVDNGNGIYTMHLTNNQSNETYDIELIDRRTNERTSIFTCYVVTDFTDFSEEDADRLRSNHYIVDNSITYLYMPFGEYSYSIEDEVGLFKIADMNTNTYVYEDNQNNNVVYYGE